MSAAAARLQTPSRQRKRILRPPSLRMLESDRVEACRRSSHSSLVHVLLAVPLLALREAWHLAELVMLFLTQAAMEMDSRWMLALLVLSLCPGMEGLRKPVSLFLQVALRVLQREPGRWHPGHACSCSVAGSGCCQRRLHRVPL